MFRLVAEVYKFMETPNTKKEQLAYSIRNHYIIVILLEFWKSTTRVSQHHQRNHNK